jgi:hypothetical protein
MDHPFNFLQRNPSSMPKLCHNAMMVVILKLPDSERCCAVYRILRMQTPFQIRIEPLAYTALLCTLIDACMLLHWIHQPKCSSGERSSSASSLAFVLSQYMDSTETAPSCSAGMHCSVKVSAICSPELVHLHLKCVFVWLSCSTTHFGSSHELLPVGHRTWIINL